MLEQNLDILGQVGRSTIKPEDHDSMVCAMQALMSSMSDAGPRNALFTPS